MSEVESSVDEDLLRQLPAEYARLADRPGVMREAAGVVGELHEAVTRLGDTIVAAGMPGRDWRSPEADVRLLSDRLPNITVDGLITRLAEFSAGNGPDWLRGDRAALDRFLEEAADLDALVRALRVAAQRLRLAPAHERVLPIETAFANVRVVTAIEQVSLALGDLVALAPFMGPLTAKQWKALKLPKPAAKAGVGAAKGPSLGVDQVGPAVGASTASAPAASAPAASAPAASAPSQDAIPTVRLRDYARTASLPLRRQTDQQAVASGLSLQRLNVVAQPLERGAAALARVARMPVRMVAVLGLILLLAVGAGVLELTHAGQAAPVPAATLVISPARLSLACAPRGRSATLTVTNPTTGPISWRVQVPAGLAISPTHDSLAAGRTVTLRVSVESTSLKAGTIAIITSRGSLAVPYTTTCK